MKIGSVELKGNVILGPMAGVTDAAFRALCKEQGASMTVTEMISAKALFYKNKNTLPLMRVSPGESPVALQLFGTEPALMAGEALKLEEGPYDIFDINMGCPMPKIVNNGEGSALMKNPKLVYDIVSAMTAKLKKPVTVKIRKGFDESCVNAPEVARAAEDAGAAAVCVHGRTREEYYSGKADWDIIRKVKESVNIPVIASGDITDGPSAAAALSQTGADGVMIARAARGNPWIFREISAYLKGEDIPPRPDIAEVKETMLRQLDMMIEGFGEYSAVRQMRRHASYYSAGWPGSSAFRFRINQAETREEFSEILSAL